jgi:hypothetical protein
MPPFSARCSVVALSLLAPSAEAYVARFNCGGPAVTTSGGQTYLADQAWSAGGAGYVGGFADETWQPIGGTPDEALYRDVRASGGYRFDVPNGLYVVTLHICDFWSNGPRINQFDVAIEGVTVLSNLDVFARVGKNYAEVHRFGTQVTDGRLDVTTHVDFGFAHLHAIAVESITADGTAPDVTAGLGVFDSHGRTSLRWTPNAEADLKGYRVFRRQEPGGAWVLQTPSHLAVSWFHDAAAEQGVTYSYYVRASDIFGNESVPSSFDSGTPLASSPLPLYELFMLPADLDQLNSVEGVEGSDYFPGTFISGNDIYQSIGLRYRGNITRTLPKKSWKVKFSSAEPFGAATRLNLNAEFPDKSLLRHALAYETFDRAGMPASRTEFVRVTLNEEYLGVHNSVQEIDRVYLIDNGLNVAGDLYEAQSNFGVLADTAAYEAAYEKKTNEDEGHGELIELIEAVNAATPATFWPLLAERLDIDNAVLWWSVNTLLTNNDFALKNYYLFRDPATEVWKVLPWDLDFTFGKSDILGQEFSHTASIFLGTSNVLVSRMATTPVLRRKHLENLVWLVRDVFTPSAYDPRIDALHELVAGDVIIDWKKYGWESSAEFLAGPNGFKSYVAGRAGVIEGSAEQFVTDEGVVINEIMARNASGAQDEMGEFEDWIEVYNGASVPKDLTGMYLTDDPGDTRKWTIPALVLPPGGYALFWADAEPAEGARHTNFRLDADGDWIGLFASDAASNIPLDFKRFGPQLENVSLGRSSEGELYWTRFGNPSPGAAAGAPPNSPPLISNTEHTPQFPASTDSVTITAAVSDANGLALVNLHVDDGAPSVLPMFDDGAHHDQGAGDGIYGGRFPPRPNGTVVSYYVRATDGTGISATDPIGAPGDTYQYEVGYTTPLLSINELLASNASINQDEAGQFDDWVEIHNYGSTPVDLGGMSLTDDIDIPTKWVFPSFVLAAGAYVLVWCDDDTGQGPLHTTFKLDAAGEEIAIFERPAFGGAMIDGFAFGLQQTNISYGHYPDDTGPFEFFGVPTPAAANQDGNGPPVIQDVTIQPNPPGPLEPVTVTAEIVDDGTLGTNRLFYDATDDAIVNFVFVTMFDDGLHGDGQAGDHVFGAVISGRPNGTPVAFYVQAQDTQGATSTAPPAGAADPYGYVVGYQPPNIVINELLAINDTTIADEFGEFEDWIELYNAGPSPVNLSGFRLSDDPETPGGYALPDVTLPSGGFLLVWADNDPTQGALHTNFSLDGAGEAIALFDDDEHFFAPIDAVTFGQQSADVSYGRLPDGGSTFVFMPEPTPGGPNELVDVLAPATAAPFGIFPTIPNPFRSGTSLRFSLDRKGAYSLRVYDVQGRLVRALRNALGVPGYQEVYWNGVDDGNRPARPGVYFIELEQASRRVTEKLLRVE